jgi:peptidoglycan/LPS O-acetylase OafA/YrhL
MPALDGIRAISILGIMANHGGFGWAVGGIISVNVFFVLSGFLITLLLLKEWSRSATIRLRAFWARRARRLLPALFVLLGGVALYSWLFAPSGTQASLRGNGIATMLYLANWHQIAAGQSYFAQVSAQSLLLHTWTLAIEEQFYLVWPLVVLGVLKLWRSPRILLLIAVAGALASAIEMALLFHPGGDPSRVYYGTDTRAQDILVGAAVAILLSSREPVMSRRARTGLSWMAVAAAAVFAFEWTKIGGASALPYRGGFLLADLMVGVVVVGVTQAPSGLPARVLSVRPLRYVGKVSYGLYLWHWPIFLALTHARTGLDGAALFAVKCAASLVMAILSWHLVETPIRRMTFTSWRSWAWLPAGAVIAVSALFVSTTASAAASGEALLGPPNPAATTPAEYVTSFPRTGGLSSVLFVGDSTALTMGYWLAPYAAHFGVVIGGRSLSGCGLANAEPYDLHGVPTYSVPPGRCQTWASQYAADVEQLHPKVVVLVVGWWETMDRMFQGRWQHLGDPAFDTYETALFEQAVTVLGSSGAHVVLMSSPYFDTGEQPDGQPWAEDAPARANLLNDIIRSVAKKHPATVTVIPLNRYLDPNGKFALKIDGNVMRTPDGVHTTQAAGTYLAPKILPELAALGRANPVAPR